METQSLYILSINVSDGTFSANASVYLTVTGVNEHTPVFSDLPNCTIPENSVYGTAVCTLRAIDADIGGDGVVSFEITAPNFIFDIDPDTGLIYTVGGTDRENISQHTLTVRVTDEGFPSLSSEVNVTMHITDLNDNSPLMHTHFFVSVPENSPTGTLVATLVCTDADQANTPNSDTELQITNLIQEHGDGSMTFTNTPLFTVASRSGELRTAMQVFD